MEVMDTMIQRKISIMCPRIKFLQLKDDKYDREL